MRRFAETSPLSLARAAGWLYLIIILGGLFGPFAVAPSGLMLGAAALPNPAKIIATPSAFFVGGLAQLVVYACDVAVAVIFYRLLKPVSQTVALVAACFRVVFAAIASGNLLNHFAALLCLSTVGELDAFQHDQLRTLACLFLKLRTLGFDVALVFFGMHCILIGYLVFRSALFPRILGIGLVVGGVGYVANISAIALPHSVAARLFPYIMLPAGITEIALTFWLIVFGVNAVRWKDLASTSGGNTEQLLMR